MIETRKLLLDISILFIIVICAYVAYRVILPVEATVTNQVLEKLDTRIKLAEERMDRIDTSLNQKVVVIRETVKVKVDSLAPDGVASALNDELNEFRSSTVRSADLVNSN